jgi:hypothetical protein
VVADAGRKSAAFNGSSHDWSASMLTTDDGRSLEAYKNPWEAIGVSNMPEELREK